MRESGKRGEGTEPVKKRGWGRSKMGASETKMKAKGSKEKEKL